MSLKILLVDDEKYAIEGLKTMLNWGSFEGELLGSASNGQEALSMISYTIPDVIISDIKMPIMDGLHLAKSVYHQSPDTEVVLLSAHGEFEYAREAMRYKVNHYILKPITREKINNLEQLLITLNLERKNKKQDFLHLWDQNFRTKIINGLRQNDEVVFDELFSSILFKSNRSNESYNHIGIQLINFLYEYLAEININKDILKQSRQKAIDDYWNLPNPEEKINYLITKYYDVLSAINDQKHANADTLITFANQYVEKHFARADFNISYLADEMHVSISYLSTIFKQSMGINLSTYIINLRLEKAKELLKNIKFSISDIAYACGYEDAKYFAKLFKKKVGITPSEYRNILVQDNHLI